MTTLVVSGQRVRTRTNSDVLTGSVGVGVDGHVGAPGHGVTRDFVNGVCIDTAIATCVGGVLQLLECDDNDICTGQEACSLGNCVAGAPPAVNDGNSCTTDACDPIVGVTHTPTPGVSCPFPFGGVCDEVGQCVLP